MKIVKILNPEKYNTFVKKYGVLAETLRNTAVINFDGYLVNIAHGDYYILSFKEWDIKDDGQVVIGSRHGKYAPTGINIFNYIK